MALNINGKKKDVAEAAVAEAVVEEAVQEAVAAPAVDMEILGTARAKLAFVCPLGDPSNPDTTKITLPDGSPSKKVTSTIVGYKFRVLEEMMVPDCGTNDGFKKDAMNYDNIDGWKKAAAGEVIKLTPFETALLLSQPQFNGGCEGGEKPVSCVYQKNAPKTKDGKVATVSAASGTPRVSLRANVGSIKDFDIEDVLTYEKVEVNGVTRKKRTIISGFEKWAPLAKDTAKKVAGGSREKASADPTKVANENAAHFLAFVNSRKGR